MAKIDTKKTRSTTRARESGGSTMTANTYIINVINMDTDKNNEKDMYK